MPSVSVPVLSVHSTSIAPRSWTAERRFTMTRCRVSRIAPRESVTETIIGSSSGVSPTASATANRNDSNTGRWSAAFTSSTKSTSSMSTSGLRKRERNSRITARSRCGRSVFGPTAARRVAASASANPCGPVRRLANRSSSGRCQKASITACYARQGAAS